MTAYRLRERLMESALARIAGGLTVEIRRGMQVQDEAGANAGVVAAIRIDASCADRAALVLWAGSLPPCYRLVAARHIASVAGEVVRLALDSAAIERLPARQATTPHKEEDEWLREP